MQQHPGELQATRNVRVACRGFCRLLGVLPYTVGSSCATCKTRGTSASCTTNCLESCALRQTMFSARQRSCRRKLFTLMNASADGGRRDLRSLMTTAMSGLAAWAVRMSASKNCGDLSLPVTLAIVSTGSFAKLKRLKASATQFWYLQPTGC